MSLLFPQAYLKHALKKLNEFKLLYLYKLFAGFNKILYYSTASDNKNN